MESGGHGSPTRARAWTIFQLFEASSTTQIHIEKNLKLALGLRIATVEVRISMSGIFNGGKIGGRDNSRRLRCGGGKAAAVTPAFTSK